MRKPRVCAISPRSTTILCALAALATGCGEAPKSGLTVNHRIHLAQNGGSGTCMTADVDYLAYDVRGPDGFVADMYRRVCSDVPRFIPREDIRLPDGAFGDYSVGLVVEGLRDFVPSLVACYVPKDVVRVTIATELEGWSATADVDLYPTSVPADYVTCFGAPEICRNNMKDGVETDTDCGGGQCAACPDGKTCSAPTDCVSGACTGGICGTGAGSTCTNSKKDGAETDVDCGGGTCPKCADGKACSAPSDCSANACTMGKCGGGGVCTADDATCTASAQCCSMACRAAGGDRTCRKVTVATCTNAVKDGRETDVDCGGADCRPCADGKACRLPTDCDSALCQGSMCAVLPPQCANKVLDLDGSGLETDVDCGGTRCPGCGVGKACKVDGDCLGGACNKMKCAGGA